MVAQRRVAVIVSLKPVTQAAQMTNVHRHHAQTGASTGIGNALARILATNGFNVALIARSADKLASLRDEINKEHGADTARVFLLDVQDQPKVDAVVVEVVQQFGQIDVLVNNVSAGDAALRRTELTCLYKGWTSTGITKAVPGSYDRGIGHGYQDQRHGSHVSHPCRVEQGHAASRSRPMRRG